jgi:hypothetical protein
MLTDTIQMRSLPIVFVAHSLGGLVVKKVLWTELNCRLSLTASGALPDIPAGCLPATTDRCHCSSNLFRNSTQSRSERPSVGQCKCSVGPKAQIHAKARRRFAGFKKAGRTLCTV